MDEGARTSGQAVDAGRQPDEIRSDIAGTREELGETVEALAAKTDVKAQAQDRVEEAKAQARSRVESVKERAESARDAAGERTPDSAAQGLDDLKRKASENPAQSAAIGAFAAGVLVGLILGRR